MIRRGHSFELDVPDGWEDESTPSRMTFRGPEGQVLIVSGVLVETTRPNAVGSQQVLDKVFENAVTAMRETMSTSSLVVLKEPGPDPTNPTLSSWTAFAQSQDRSVLFLQAAVSSEAGVLLVTLEGATSPELAALFRSLLARIRRAPTN